MRDKDDVIDELMRGDTIVSPLSVRPEIVRGSGGKILALPKRSQLLNPKPELQEKLTLFKTMIQAGNYVDTSLAFAGIEKAAYVWWCRRGWQEREWYEQEMAELEARGIDEELQRGPHHQFLVDVDKAMAMAEAADVDSLRKAGIRGNVTATLLRLKKRNPKRWADSVADAQPKGTTVNVNNQSNVQVNVHVERAYQLRTIMQEDPELCELISALAEKAEKVDIHAAANRHLSAEAGTRAAGEDAAETLVGEGAEVAGPPRDEGTLARGPLGLRNSSDEE